jgi:ribosome-associated translation inhibitor RaiA
MLVQTNTDRSIEGSQKLAGEVEAVVIDALSRFTDRITRVEVHLSDENSAKGGADDKRCMMEARLDGRPPTAVSHKAATLEEAIAGAAEKLARNLDSTLGRLRDR